MKRIGVFDSGVGGLSVLRALLRELPEAHYVYFADSAYAPYGDKTDTYIMQRSAHITAALLGYGIDILVIACNTATAIAATHIRSLHPTLPIVAIEPALKPAAQLSQTKRIGVMATAGTVASARFQNLRSRIEQLSPPVHFQVLACEGLASAIEHRFLTGERTPAEDLARHFAAQFHDIDTLVLGCTHYPFVQEALGNYFKVNSPRNVQIIEPSGAVALQTKRLLQQGDTEPNPAFAPTKRPITPPFGVTLLSSGDKKLLEATYAFVRNGSPT